MLLLKIKNRKRLALIYPIMERYAIKSSAYIQVMPNIDAGSDKFYQSVSLPNDNMSYR